MRNRTGISNADTDPGENMNAYLDKEESGSILRQFRGDKIKCGFGSIPLFLKLVYYRYVTVWFAPEKIKRFDLL